MELSNGIADISFFKFPIIYHTLFVLRVCVPKLGKSAKYIYI